MTEAKNLMDGLVTLLRDQLSRSDLRAFPFASPTAGTGAVWACALSGGTWTVSGSDFYGSELCSRYDFTLDDGSLRLTRLDVRRHPATLTGWLQEVADCNPVPEGLAFTQERTPDQMRGRFTPVSIDVVRRLDDLNDSTGYVVPADEVGHLIATMPVQDGRQWSAQQDIFAVLGPPAVRLDVLNCPSWMRGAFGPVWEGLSFVGRTTTCKMLRNSDFATWMAGYLDVTEPAVVAFGGKRQRNWIAKLRARLQEATD